MRTMTTADSERKRRNKLSTTLHRVDRANSLKLREIADVYNCCTKHTKTPEVLESVSAQ